MDPPIFETERLTVAPVTLGDVEPLVLVLADRGALSDVWSGSGSDRKKASTTAGGRTSFIRCHGRSFGRVGKSAGDHRHE